MSRQIDPDFLASDALPTRSTATAGKPAFQLDLKRALQMHPALAAVTAALVMAALLLAGLLLKTQYQASAVFTVSPTTTSLLSPGSAPSYTDSNQFDSTVQQEVETLERVDTATAVVRSLPEGVWRQPGETVAAASARLQRSLTAGRMGTSQQVLATLTGPRAADTQEAMAAVVTQFMKVAHRDEDGQAAERVQLLKGEMSRVQASLDVDRAAAAQLSAQFGVSRLGETDKTPLDQNVSDLRQQLSDLRRAKSYASAGLAQPGTGIGNDEYNSNLSTSGLVAQINARKAQLQSQMAGMTAANPIYQQDVEEMRSMDRELQSATQRGDTEQQRRQRLTRDRAMSGVAQEESQVERQLAEQTGQAAAVSSRVQRYSALMSEISLLQTRLGTVRDAISNTQLEANGPSRVILDVAPTEAVAATSSKRRLALLGALPLGLLAGLLAAVLAQRQDRRVFLAVDLEQVLGIKPMAVLPAASEVSDALAEQGLLRMAGSIETAYLKNRSKTFVFTASSPDAQVEELVYRLQGKLKELGYKALWVGAETLLRAERDFEQLYGRGLDSGGDVRFSETSGKSDRGAGADGVAVQRLNWLKRDYDMVLIDAPPLLLSAMAEYAVRRTDATILVSESGVTTREELQAAAGLLEQLGTTGIGAVLQDLHMRYASPEEKKKLRRAEEIAARPVGREPLDNHGEWQTLHAGTIEELHVPGDPDVVRAVSRIRPRTRRMTNMAWDKPDEPRVHTVEDARWHEELPVEEVAYTAGRE